MKIAAIIAEYNPFHNGHLYQLDTVRETLGADYIIIIMSGDFVQRGMPAVIDKYARCRIALTCGADAVFELPVCFSLGSAEYFAQGAVSLLDRLGVVDVLHFGSECGDIRLLCEYAEILAAETDQYRHQLNLYLKEGKSFPLARSETVKDLLSDSYKKEAFDVLSNPNNILALEYIKALKQQKSPITPLTLKRCGADFHSDAFTDGAYASANAIRKHLLDMPDTLSVLAKYIPDACLEELHKSTFVFPNDFSSALLYKLLQVADLGNGFSHFYDIGSELSNVITSNITGFSSLEAFAHLCKSRNLTYTRICRGLMHILLDMTQENADLLKADGYCSYARLLGFRTKNKKSELLRLIKKNASIPIITSPSKGLHQLTGNALTSLKADIHAANLYEGIKMQKMTHVSPFNELTREIIKLPQQ